MNPKFRTKRVPKCPRTAMKAQTVTIPAAAATPDAARGAEHSRTHILNPPHSFGPDEPDETVEYRNERAIFLL